MNKKIYNKKAQLSLAIILGIIALVLGLIFALPVILPDSVKTMIENYKITKIIDQVESEKKASLKGYPALLVVGHKTVVNSTDMTIQTYLKNVGGSKCIDPTVKHIIVKDAEPGVTKGTQIGSPIFGGVFRKQLYPGATQAFTIGFATSNTPLCRLLDPTDLAFGDPDHQLELQIRAQCYTTTGHQIQETETVVVTPSGDSGDFKGCPNGVVVEEVVDNPPTVTLNSPVDNTITNNTDIIFNCSATDDNELVDITFYWNESGVFEANETSLVSGTSATVDFNKTLGFNNTIIWNCKATDDASQSSFALNNFTLTVNQTVVEEVVAPVIDGKLDNIYLSGQIQEMCDLSLSAHVGTLYILQNDSNLFVAYVQNKSLIDNTYGNNSIGWTPPHKFKHLKSSDKARFRFTDGSNTTVLDFDLDYLSEDPSFPSGYGSLGATGGDGKMHTGDSAWILADTSQDWNMNNASPSYPDKVIKSPPTDSNYTQNPNYPWIFENLYEMRIDKTAFGVAGFGNVTIPKVHDSPNKLGDSSIFPVPCP
jgi:hypothetical protein